VLAYHDRSDGGLFATVTEMAFAGHCGVDIVLDAKRGPALAQLFSEELGAVIQVREADEPRVRQHIREAQPYSARVAHRQAGRIA